MHKKNGEFVGNERREKEKAACVGDRKTDREKRVRLQRYTGGEKGREVQFSTCCCLILSTSIIMHQNNSFFFSRKRNNVPQVKELSRLFSFSAKLTLST